MVNEVPAGNIVGIGGLEEYLIKTGTISTFNECPNFAKTKTISLGLVKVAVEAENLSQMKYL